VGQKWTTALERFKDVGSETQCSNFRFSVPNFWSTMLLITRAQQKNDPLRENFQNSVRKGFIATLIDVLCSNVAKFGREIGKVARYLPDKTKFRLALQLSLYSARIAPKI